MLKNILKIELRQKQWERRPVFTETKIGNILSLLHKLVIGGRTHLLLPSSENKQNVVGLVSSVSIVL